jgi:hypothetical protein
MPQQHLTRPQADLTGAVGKRVVHGRVASDPRIERAHFGAHH